MSTRLALSTAALALLSALATHATPYPPYFSISTESEWQSALASGNITP